MAGVVSAGHEKTAEAGQAILQAGGNAFDAAVAAAFMACVAEPTLTSLAGGGFLLAHQADGPAGDRDKLFDFFTQTPSARAAGDELDFYPIEANFGDTVQEFHIGMASMAVPGVLAGLLTVHRQLGRLPLTEVVAPAVDCARQGLAVSGFQAYCYELLEPILIATEAARNIYAPQGGLLVAGDRIHMSEFADTLESLASLGDEGALQAFYKGEIAQRIVRDCKVGGGCLRMEDFEQYKVMVRSPLSIHYRGRQLLTNPPPSAGGSLIAFCLELLDRFDLGAMTFGSDEHLTLLSQAMRWTNEARRSHLDKSLFDPDIADAFTAADLVDKYVQPLQSLMNEHMNRWGSTTHISVMDEEGNAASITTSNGEGSSYVIPGTQIMMNNMLGEEDLNPHGFHQWPLNRRMSSMMAPTIMLKGGKPQLALGSGGSNRIRTAVLQVISNIVDFGMPLAEAVSAPRIHWEGGVFHLEPELGSDALKTTALSQEMLLKTDKVVRWQQSNMFFGGVHAVGLETTDETVDETTGEATGKTTSELQGAGDPRRSGAVAKSVVPS